MIIRNSARCKKCQEEVISRHRYDFVTCKCGALSVDGGLAYLKRCGNMEDREETSIIEEQEDRT